MKIENKEYYHVHRQQNNPHSSRWNVGSTISFGDEENLFNTLFNSFFVELQTTPIIATSSLSVQNVSEHLKNTILRYSMYVREEIFEEVRKNKFPNRPSRKTGIWVCEENQVNGWLHAIGNEFQNNDRVFKVLLSGEIHKADEKWVRMDGSLHPFCKIREKAHKYWQDDHSQYENPEFLFQGEVYIASDVTADYQR